MVEQARAALTTACEVLGVDQVRLPDARVDGIERDGTFRLMELELVELYLGLRRADAVESFADAVESAVDQELATARS